MKNLWVGLAALPPIIVFTFATFAIDQQKAESEYWQWRADNGNGPLAPNRP